MVSPIRHMLLLTTIRRDRHLAGEGILLVGVNDMVSAADPVARSQMEAQHVILDAARALGLPPERAKKLIQRNVGEPVEAGAILAGRRGVGVRQLRAPKAGKVVAISEAQILLQVSDETSLLPARVPGQVVDIEPNRGVTIEFIGAWIQCAWGNGQFADGVIHLASEKPDQGLTADLIDMSKRGVILVAGSCEQRQALELAAQAPIRGLVLGSLATRLLPLAQKLAYPIVLIEGFGNTPMNSEAFKLLAAHLGKQATVNAQITNHLNGDSPEVLIPIQSEANPPEPGPPRGFRVGQTVKILSGQHRGHIGHIASLLPPSTLYPSGLHAAGAEVTLLGQDRVAYPLVNLELLG